MIKITSEGDFSKTFKFLEKAKKLNTKQILEKYAKVGVTALANATPVDSGLTANSWTYEISVAGESASINWVNTNVNKGVNIALILQFGHGTGTGGYVQGIDYINPAMKPIFDKLAEEVWSEVINA